MSSTLDVMAELRKLGIGTGPAVEAVEPVEDEISITVEDEPPSKPEYGSSIADRLLVLSLQAEKIAEAVNGLHEVHRQLTDELAGIRTMMSAAVSQNNSGE